jgi:prepilin-type N-terminal cleavage/methylation domain-containing protein
LTDMDHPHRNRAARHRATTRESSARAGFTLIELMVVVGLIGVMSAVAIMVAPSALRSAKADSGGAHVMAALRTAREQAIAQRRNVRVTFTAPNVVTATRVEVPGPATTVLGTTYLEDGVRFLQFVGIPDTPDAFGNGSATSFGTATSYFFTSEGTFVDQNGDSVNGTVFLGRVNDPLSARAVSLFGPTALIRLWRWDGRQWTN